MPKETGKIKWRELPLGMMITRPGSSEDYHTGTWRSQHPVRNNERCFKCGMCYIFCPEGCIHQGPDGYFFADLRYCKGCGICAQECWSDTITMEEETE